jgi:hypothetical protein
MIKLGDVELDDESLSCHLWCYGESGVGKSKCIECICRALIARRAGFVFVDPHGSTVRDILKWCAVWRPKRQIYLLDTSRKDRIVGTCPFYSESKEPDELSTTVEGCVSATMKAWGHDPLQTPRLAKWLRRLYRTIIEQDLPLTVLDHFLSYKHPKALEILRGSSEKVKEWWKDIYKDRKEFASFLESSESRLEIFQHPQVRRILSLKENSLDLEKIWEEGSILLVNLQPSHIMDEEHNRTVGTLLINQLVQIALKKRDNKRLYLILDECWKYITSDFRAILDETRKRGLSLLAFHQRLGQLDKNTASALENAKVRIVFSTKENPKPQRHFDCYLRGGEKRSSQMHNISDAYITDERLEEYIRSLISPFFACSTVDQILASNDYEKELSDDDFGR